MENSSSISDLFEIKTSVIMGRHVIASKPIKAGDAIIIEHPSVVGPPLRGSFFCLGCNKSLDLIESCYRCPECLAILCKANCNGPVGHSSNECKFLKLNEIFITRINLDASTIKSINEILFPLRCLLLKKFNNDEWQRVIVLESHNEIRKDIPLHWLRNQFQIVDRIRENWGIVEFSEDEIHTICGIIKVNCFGVGRQGIRGRGLYCLTSLLSHDCCPNTRTLIDPSTFQMTIRAMQDINCGEMITISYVEVFSGTLQRRDKLKTGKFFWCTCKRCSDSSEFGTNCSGFRCTKCSDGIVLSTNPLDESASWQCSNCNTTIEPNFISAICGHLADELETIDPLDTSSIQMFIQKAQKILVNNHYLLLSAKYKFIQCSKNDSAGMKSHCLHLLEIINILEPGLSRVKGIILYRLYTTSVFSATMQLKGKEITKGKFQQIVREALVYLKESERILKMEPDGSMGKRIADKANSILRQLREQVCVN